MIKFEYNGEIYQITKNAVYQSYIEVPREIAQEVSIAYLNTINYTTCSEEELKALIEQVNNLQQYEKCIEMIQYGVNTFKSINFIRYTSAIVCSLYRKMHKPEMAIKYALQFLAKYNCPSVPLLTSLAAAYCDIGDWEKGEKCCNRAYRLQNGGTGHNNELSAVYGRIRKHKETGE